MLISSLFSMCLSVYSKPWEKCSRAGFLLLSSPVTSAVLLAPGNNQRGGRTYMALQGRKGMASVFLNCLILSLVLGQLNLFTELHYISCKALKYSKITVKDIDLKKIKNSPGSMPRLERIHALGHGAE